MARRQRYGSSQGPIICHRGSDEP
jgi:outer membrane immunogenic protein